MNDAPCFQFDFGLDSSSALGDSLLVYLRTAFPPVLKDKFEAFRPALLAAHGAPDGPPPPVTESSAPSYNPAPPTKAETVATKSRAALAEGKKKVGSTATVEVQATMHASAQDLWGLLTDDGKIPMWSRSAAKVRDVKNEERYICQLRRADELEIRDAIRAIWRQCERQGGRV